jgi:hypothetical protein
LGNGSQEVTGFQYGHAFDVDVRADEIVLGRDFTFAFGVAYDHTCV